MPTLSNGYQLTTRFRLYADRLAKRDVLTRSVVSLKLDLAGTDPARRLAIESIQDQLTRMRHSLQIVQAGIDADRAILEALKGDYLRSGRTWEELDELLSGIAGP